MFKVGDKVRVKQGTTAKARKSSMNHWRRCPELDGLTFTIETLTEDQSGCYIDKTLIYGLPFSEIEKA